MWPALETLLPSAGLLFLLYLVLRHMMEGDRRERMAQAKWEQEHGVVSPAAQGRAAIDNPVINTGTAQARTADNTATDSSVIDDTTTAAAKTPDDS